MDPVTLATTAIAVLGPFLGKLTEGGLNRAGEAAADGTGDRIRTLYQAIRRRMSGDAYNQAILEGAEEEPDSTNRLETLTRTLGDILEHDPEFATELAKLLEQATAGQTIQANESGGIAGRDFHQSGTFVAGRDLNIG